MAQFLSINQFYGFFLVTDCKEKEVPFCIGRKNSFLPKNVQIHFQVIIFEDWNVNKQLMFGVNKVYPSNAVHISHSWIAFPSSDSWGLFTTIHFFWLYYNGTLNFFLSWNIPFWFWLTTRLTFFTNSHIKSL